MIKHVLLFSVLFALSGCTTSKTSLPPSIGSDELTLPSSAASLILKLSGSSEITDLREVVYMITPIEKDEYLYVSGGCTPLPGVKNTYNDFWYLLRKRGDQTDWSSAEVGITITATTSGEIAYCILTDWPGFETKLKMLKQEDYIKMYPNKPQEDTSQ